jgi:hypothetical protein
MAGLELQVCRPSTLLLLIEAASRRYDVHVRVSTDGHVHLGGEKILSIAVILCWASIGIPGHPLARTGG